MSVRLVTAAFGSALLAALLLPGKPTGLGVAVAGLAVIAITVTATRPRDPWRIACWAVAAALAVMPAVRSAGWVVFLSLLAAVTLGSLAASGARTWREVLAGALGSVIHLTPGFLMLAFAAVAAGGRRGLGRLGPSARGAALATLLLAVFLPLFLTADAAFAQIVDDTFDWDVTDRAVQRIAVFALVAGLTGALILTAATRLPAPGAGRPNLGRQLVLWNGT